MEKDEAKCSKCRKLFTNLSESIKCFLCQERLHVKCGEPNFGNMVVEALSGGRGMRWVCIRCDKEVAVKASSIQETATTKCVEQFDERIKKLESTIELLLGEKNNKAKGQKPTQSWSKIVTIVPKSNCDPNDANKTNLREKVRKAINPQSIQATDMRSTTDGGIKFNCCPKDEKKKLEENIKKKLGKSYDVKITDEKKPKIKITGFFDDEQTKHEDVEQMMRSQNLHVLREAELKILRIQGAKSNKDVKTIIAEVNYEAYEGLMKEGTININWSRCKVFDGNDVMRCFKCSRYSHRADVCNRQPCCPKCMGKHTLKEHRADEKDEKCINCFEANEQLKLKLDVNHSVWNENCQTYKRKLKNVKSFLKMPR